MVRVSVRAERTEKEEEQQGQPLFASGHVVTERLRCQVSLFHLLRQPFAVQVYVVLVVLQERFRHDAPTDHLFRLVQNTVPVDVEPLDGAAATRVVEAVFVTKKICEVERRTREEAESGGGLPTALCGRIAVSRGLRHCL